MNIIITVCLLVFAASYLLTGIIRRYAINQRLMDIPNARSSHVVATPRGGGLAVVIVFLSGIGGLALTYSPEFNPAFIPILILAGTLVAGIGFWDDHRPLSAKWRFLVHFLAGTGALLYLPELPVIHFFSFALKSQVVLFLLYVLMLVWILNLYNFMDGIDGIAAVEALTTAGSAVLLLWFQGQIDWVLIPLLLLVSVSGFLVWNWPPAKIFMGDACSGFLGFVLGLLAIMTSINGALNIWCWWILLAVFIVDATTTLIIRMLRGEIWHQAHRSHAYQILSRRLASHKKVTLGVLLINIFWLLPLAYLTLKVEVWAPLICLLAMTPLFFLAYTAGAGTTND
ncbi:glycosyltransferase family 4 protein [Methylicorpusculum oleiharenae]|uniref:MraY family glycosyltransferase n=1 Tax=Methylicorpusculum oleiharenae TaxID=1338687 RepID=UPI0013573E71|nr:glycosyltransferase family 4 protein [Methylicorpusculum oleiharenae]MCD2449770.1 glycosyltransferase family 4 protein [Methylicorpusculum oleiharenae]